MKQSLQIGLSQQLKMTPQLQQAIRLLQLPSLELQQEIQEALYDNPLLEMDEQANESDSDNNEANVSEEAATKVVEEEPYEPISEFQSEKPSTSYSEDFNIDYEDQSGNNLQDYLFWQLNLNHFSPTDQVIAEHIIDAVGDDGLLTSSPESIWEGILEELEISDEECYAVLHRVQHFDPPGIAAADLKNCLQIQLDMLLDDTPFLATTQLLVDQYLNLITRIDSQGLAKQLRVSEAEIIGALELLKTLNPRPGYRFNNKSADYIIPDIIVNKRNGVWQARCNPDIAPKLKLSDDFTRFLEQAKNNTDKEYIKNKAQDARWLLRSLASRNDTLLSVANEIVTLQQGFFDKGPEAMKPLILKDLAERLGFHESTISRATNQKYLLCPKGVIELKYFFSSQVSTSSGGEASSTAIKAMIRKLIDAENPKKPLSDSKLTQLLNEKGIKVARRTVAKYREMEDIASSSERKRFN